MTFPARIVSGGQTGVDRAALDAARDLELPHGGWCPAGRRAEDGPIPPHYPLVETPERSYTVRTERNVLDADATLILYRQHLRGGTALTRTLAAKHQKPYLLVDLQDPHAPSPNDVATWLRREAVHTLNVAGPRESGQPGIHAQAQTFLAHTLHATRAWADVPHTQLLHFDL